MRQTRSLEIVRPRERALLLRYMERFARIIGKQDQKLVSARIYR